MAESQNTQSLPKAYMTAFALQAQDQMGTRIFNIAHGWKCYSPSNKLQIEREQETSSYYTVWYFKLNTVFN